MATALAAGTAVLVGNLPADATEQMLIAEFSTVGAVSSVRLAVDRESGQPKGYGLCYFLDADTAASAVRKMNRAVFRGRTLRVALADEDGDKLEDVKVDLDSKGGPKALSAADQVAIVESAVDLMSHQQRVEFLAQMKVFAQQNPHHATALLLQNPQLAQLMLHLQVLFDMVQTADIAQVSAMQQQQSQMPAAAPMPVAPVAEPTLSATQQQQLQYFLSLSAAELSHLPPEVQEQVRILRAAAGLR